MNTQVKLAGRSIGQFALLGFRLAGVAMLLMASLLNPGTVLAHPSGVTERVSVDSS